MPLLYLRYAKYATSPDLILKRGGHLTEIWIDLSFGGGRKKVFFFGDEFAQGRVQVFSFRFIVS